MSLTKLPKALRWRVVNVGYWPPGWAVVFTERFRPEELPPRLPVVASIVEESGDSRRVVPGVLWNGEIVPAQDLSWIEAMLSPNGMPYYPDNE